MLLEREKADRFGPARSGGYIIASREQSEKLLEIINEQQTTGDDSSEEINEATTASVEDRFNTR